MPIRSRNFSDLMDPWRAANLITAAMIGREVNRFLKKGEKAAEKAVENAEDNVKGALARKIQVESKLRDTAAATREVNAQRKHTGLQPTLTEKEVIREIKEEFKEAEADYLNEKRKKAASTLFGSLARVAGTRGMYNTNLAPKVSQWVFDLITPKEK